MSQRVYVRWGRRAALGTAFSIAVIGGLQLLPSPQRTNPPVSFSRTIEANLEIPQDVSGTMHRACSNCHSNQTRWPWYSGIAPFSWLIGADVNKARHSMNFSEWRSPQEPSAWTRGNLAASCAVLEAGIMPPRNYMLLHPEARLSEPEKRAFCGWTQREIVAQASWRAARTVPR
jgi:hypothetical protein